MNPKKRRRAITDAQRKSLRDYAVDTSQHDTLPPPQKKLERWFNEKYHHRLAQSTLSDILSSKFAHLDNCKRAQRPDNERKRVAYWPDLEDALFDLQQRLQKKEAPMTGEMLKQLAADLWQKLPQYRDLPVPKWSNGWLQAFKDRHYIKRYTRHGEAGAVNRVVVEEELIKIREDLKLYPSQDIFNMDESALFWKMTPDGTLATEQTPGGKREKARVTVNFCCNVTGTEKLPLWLIGKAQKPRCFGRAGIKAENLNVVWRANQKAWMTGRLFKEYLMWFDGKMYGRKVVLLIDGFSAHQSGIDLYLSKYPAGLKHTKIIFLPPNATSICQPLDQGIIRAWKAHYRKRWLRFIIDHYIDGKDPMKAITVLQAIRWGIESWEAGVTETTIHNCWVKARVLGPKMGPCTEREARDSGWDEDIAADKAILDTVTKEVGQGITSLLSQDRIKSAMAIETFLNPIEERVIDTDDDMLEAVAEAYSTEERLFESDEDEDPTPIVRAQDVLYGLRMLRLHEEQYDGGDGEFISRLNRQERVLMERSAPLLEQATITSYFT